MAKPTPKSPSHEQSAARGSPTPRPQATNSLLHTLHSFLVLLAYPLLLCAPHPYEPRRHARPPRPAYRLPHWCLPVPLTASASCGSGSPGLRMSRPRGACSICDWFAREGKGREHGESLAEASTPGQQGRPASQSQEEDSPTQGLAAPSGCVAPRSLTSTALHLSHDVDYVDVGLAGLEGLQHHRPQRLPARQDGLEGLRHEAGCKRERRAGVKAGSRFRGGGGQV